MILFMFLVQVLSTTFMREGLSNHMLMGAYKLPKIFTKLVYSLSFLRRADLKVFEYNVKEFSSFATFIKYCETLLESDTY